MIVKCEQCQTRFKIPDDKVTDKGVKVRCTKCGHTFRVTKEGAPASSPSSSGVAPPATQTFPVVPPVAPVPGKPTLPAKSIQIGGDDPFSAFGYPPGVPDPEATRPGVFVLGLEASKVPDIGAPPIPPQAKTPAVGSAFDFGSLSPPPPVPAAPAVAPVTRPVPRSSAPTASLPAAPVPPPSAAPAASPFDFSALMPTAPAATAQPAPFDFSALSAPPAPAPAPAPAARPAAPAAATTPAFDFSSLGSLPGVPPPAAAPAAPAPAFDFSGLGAPPGGAPAAAAPVAPAPAFDFSGLGAPPGPAPDAATAPLAALPTTQTGRIPMGSQSGVSPRPPGTQTNPAASPVAPTQPAVAAYVPPSAPKPAARPQSSAPLSLEGDDVGLGPMDAASKTEQLPSLFGGQAPGSGADDFFGSAIPEAQKAPTLAPDITGEAAKQALFDMAAALPPAPEDEPTAAAEAPAPAPAPRPVVSRAAAAAEAPGRRRTVLGVVVNLVIAAVLVLALVVVGSALLNEGKVSADTLSWEHLKTTFAPSSDFVAGDISNGLYDTKAGKPVFFVRGEVTNRGDRPVKLQVRAELVEGSTLVRSAESTAGTPASPEEIFLLATAEDLDALNAKVEARSAVLEPGASAPFIVVFFEYPPDLKGFRVRVSARPTATPTATREP